jgi:hypothetical protein
MKTNTLPPQAPESYATFWEPLGAPVAADPTAPLQRPAPEPLPTHEFANVPADAPVSARPERV